MVNTASKTAFLTWYKPYHQRLLRYCSSRAFGVMDAEDLMQEAILATLSNWDNIKDHSKLLAAGAAGKRSGLAHSRVTIHQPSGGMQGQVSDMEIAYRMIKGLQEELYQILSKHTGKPFDTIREDGDRDHWMSANEAKMYGILDEVVG